MGNDNIKKIYDLLDKIPVNSSNKETIEKIREYLLNGDFVSAVEKLKQLQEEQTKEDQLQEAQEAADEGIQVYPEELHADELEERFMGLLLNEPKQIVKFYYPFKECMFESKEILNLYKSVLFTEGGDYAPENAKAGFNFAIDTEESYQLKQKLKKEMSDEDYSMETTFLELKKIFILRKNYIETPVKQIQKRILEITQYELYKDMTPEEVESAVRQVSDTEKFKRAILNDNLSYFLRAGENNLTDGLAMPFPILSSVFKGIRRGETMAFAMPSNTGKSRMTINVAAYTAFVHKKKVLIISNEMSEEKMKLCLITTIINHPGIKKMHGIDVVKSEGELLEFKFRPDKKTGVKVDEEGFVLREEGETQSQFAKRLSTISTEFNKVIQITDWANKEMKDCIHFINITDHTNDEIRKVIMNYYYKEKIEYVFYDTLKTDIANIGIGEELKKTATILSNLAQNFGMFICSTLQLTENDTLPINMSVVDLSASRTVKEVLDTLTMIKQISRDNLKDYEYSIEEVDTKFYDLENVKDPNVRYYACVVDKNRAGSKPKLLFRVNLAYNSWEELGFLRLKQEKENKAIKNSVTKNEK